MPCTAIKRSRRRGLIKKPDTKREFRLSTQNMEAPLGAGCVETSQGPLSSPVLLQLPVSPSLSSVLSPFSLLSSRHSHSQTYSLSTSLTLSSLGNMADYMASQARTKNKVAPSHYPFLLFHGVRCAQFVSSAVVGAIMFYFIVRPLPASIAHRIMLTRSVSSRPRSLVYPVDIYLGTRAHIPISPIIGC